MTGPVRRARPTGRGEPERLALGVVFRLVVVHNVAARADAGAEAAFDGGAWLTAVA